MTRTPDPTAAHLRRVLATLLTTGTGVCPEVSPEDEMFSYPMRLRGASAEEAAIEYFRIGHETFGVLDAALRWAGGRWPGSRVLDFASGYGRVSRFFADAIADGRLTVADILEPAVEFQKQHLGVSGIVSFTNPKKLTLADGYDCITVVSLFSHLPDKTFRSWLAKLAGALSDGGLMLITTHGEHAFSVTEDAGPLQKDFVFWPLSESRLLRHADYGKSFCRPEYVQRIVDRIPGVVVLGHLPHVVNDHQDLYVLSRGRTAPTTPCVIASPPRTHIDEARHETGGQLTVSGWALTEPEKGPVRRVTIHADDAILGDATLGVARPDLAAAMGSPAAEAGGFRFAVPSRKDAPTWVAARGEGPDGPAGFAAARVTDC